MFNGYDIDMLALGDADSILVTGWEANVASRVLIDGGNKGDGEKVINHLKSLGVTRLDAVVNTHPHDDHAGGLLKLLEDQSIAIGQLFLHVPQWHVQMDKVRKAIADTRLLQESLQIEKSLQTVASLYDAANARGIRIAEPFQGDKIAFLTVVGPSKAYYEQLVKEFEDPDRIRTVSKNEAAWDIERLRIEKNEISDSLLDNPETTPENDSSVVLAFEHRGGIYLLTADAGVPALQNAADAYPAALKDLAWMQIPHHGSRHNINVALINHLNPKQAWVSACGDRKHPRRSVVNAFKNKGATVYSTHYPNNSILHLGIGNAPARQGYISATPLWD